MLVTITTVFIAFTTAGHVGCQLAGKTDCINTVKIEYVYPNSKG